MLYTFRFNVVDGPPDTTPVSWMSFVLESPFDLGDDDTQIIAESLAEVMRNRLVYVGVCRVETTG